MAEPPEASPAVVTRQELDEALRAQAAEFTRQDQMKDQFLAVLGHELRQPLNAIKLAAAVLRKTTDAPTLVRMSDMLDRQVGQLTRLVDDLLDVSRIKRGKVALQTGRVDVREVIGHAAETVRDALASRKQQFAVEIEDGPLHAAGDRQRLQQVVGNLLQNASQSAPVGGHVAVHACAEPGTVRVDVVDDGNGIDPERLPTLFEPFVQGGDRSGGGLGLGLALVKGLVDLHGGTVVAESDGAGRGSRFIVRVPAYPPS